ncbi:MAG: diguanylate cyclase [Candidatus Desulfofervidaceae bacterium]|nr:diguanylate cyclase [Candidatus Desulfofervidaceae bacterium]
MKRNSILLVDDSVLVLKMLSAFLEKNGYRVTTAMNGLEAIEKVYNEPPDIILLDIMMPKMNGYQVCRLLKNDEQTKYIPIIMFTSKDKPIDKFWGLQTGADAYVAKDIAYDKLLQIIATSLEKVKDRKHKKLKPEQPITLIDILLKTNELLDRKLYEVTIINRITTLSRNIHAYKKIIDDILTILYELINYQLATVFVTDVNSGTLFVKSDLYPHKEDLIELENFCSSQFQVQDLEIPPQIEPVILAPEEAEETKIITDAEAFYLFQSKAKEIKEKENIWGGFIFYGETVKDLSENEKAILELILEQAFVIAENAYLYEKIRLKSVTDELTGLYNRRYFFERLTEEYEKTKRHSELEFSVIMLDIDHFKKINDTYGHMAGDVVLKMLARIMKNSVRTTDIAARFGGEEFIFLLPQTPLKGGIVFAERLRKTVEEYNFQALGHKIPVTISLGVSNYNNKLPYTLDEIIKNTDEALYQAKETGRNKVCVHEED